MPGARIGRPPNLDPEVRPCTSEQAGSESTRTSASAPSSPGALVALWEMRQQTRARAASLIVGDRKNGFRQASSMLSEIARDDPSDWRTHACRALVAWSNGEVDRDALLALEQAGTKHADLLQRAHAIIEQSLRANPFGDPSVATGARPAIVVPGKQLSQAGTMDRDLLARMETALEFARKYPDAPIVLSGGATVTKTTECSVMAGWLTENGVSPERLLLDPLATVTTANSLQTIALLRTRPGTDQLLLVTDDDHIRRANVIFGITLLRSDLRMTLTPVSAGGSKAGKLAAPADDEDRAKVYLDAMHACQLFAYRGRPKFYQDGNIIGDEIPGDEKASVEVALGAPGSAGGKREFAVIVKQLSRGELPRGAESALLERLLRKYEIAPKAFRVDKAAPTDVLKAVIETIEGLGLESSHTEEAADHIKVHIQSAATANHEGPPGERADAASVNRTVSRWLPRDPVVDGRQERAADQRDTTHFAAPMLGPLVIGEPRFLVSPDNKTYLNGAIHAVDVDSIRTHDDASCDEIRIRVGPEHWNEADLMKLGSEGARLLREDGRLIVSTGAEPHAPIEGFVKALTMHGFSVSIHAPEETPFYPILSDPSAGGVTFECRKLPAQRRSKRPRASDSTGEGPARVKMRRPGAV